MGRLPALMRWASARFRIIMGALGALLAGQAGSGGPQLDVLPGDRLAQGCYATPWTADRDRVEALVESLRRQGYIVSAQYGVRQHQAGYRVADPGRVRLRDAQDLIEEADVEGLEATIATGADGRPTVSYGHFPELEQAEARRAELAKRGIGAQVEPAYRARLTGRAVIVEPLAGSAIVSFGSLWEPVDCEVLDW